MQLRRQGVWGYNLPPQVGSSVLPASFNIAGMIGRFSRGIDDIVEINQMSEISIKLGNYKSGYYGRYVLENFFQNLQGQSAKIYVKPFVASDSVQASISLSDGSNPTLKIKSALNGVTDKSLDGNNSGIVLENGNRFNTQVTSNAIIGATSIVLDSVIGLRIGDVLKIVSGATTHYTKISTIDENTKTLTVSALTNAISTADEVYAIGFKIVCYRKNENGVPIKVQIPENEYWLSMESENTEFYIGNRFKNHPYIYLEDLNSATATYPDRLIPDTSLTFLSGGSDGTSPSSTSDWNLYSSFDTKNIRFLFNSDTTLSGVNEAGENYCINRLDTPIWIANISNSLSKSDIIKEGQKYQRSNQVQMVVCAGQKDMLVNDPIGKGNNPVINIPVIGAVVGAWIRAFYRFGFHRVPAGDDVPLLGFSSLVNSNGNDFTEDDRTDIANSGVNLVQNIPGRGVLLRSFYTPSTNIGSFYGHYLLMQNFIKISSVESLYRAENKPNRLSSLKLYGDAIKDFGRKLYTGSFPYGIDTAGAFGEYTKSDGTLSGFDDVFIVQADQFNNPNESIVIGEGNVFVRFFPPPLLGSLAIGVGVLIPL